MAVVWAAGGRAVGRGGVGVVIEPLSWPHHPDGKPLAAPEWNAAARAARERVDDPCDEWRTE